MPEISVIIPVYNAEKYLNRCIESVVCQSLRDIEIILVNDGSTDESLKICRMWKKKDDRIVLLNKENGGASSARNLALQYAKGNYIGFVDSDDWIDSEMYENLLLLINESNADMAICELMIHSNNKIVDNKIMNYPSTIWGKEELLDHFFRVRGERDTHCICVRLIKKTVFDGWSFIEGKMNEDVHACYCMAVNSKKAVYTDKQYYHYIRNKEGITNNQFSFKKMDLIYIWNIVRKMVLENNPNYIELCDINISRAYMTLLFRMYKDGFDKKNIEYIKLKKLLKSKARESYWDLIRWNMPLNRKLMLTLLVL